MRHLFVAPVPSSPSGSPDVEDGTSLVQRDVTPTTAATTGPSAGEQPCLVVTHASRPEAIGQVFPIEAEEIVLGRGDDVDVRVADPGASRRHARIARRDGEHVLTDLGSLNGTLVNGVRIRSSTLMEGDRIQIGTVTALRFSLRGELHASEARLRQALAGGGVGAWEWEVASRELRFSEEVRRLLRLDATVAPWSLFAEDDRRHLVEALGTAVSGRVPVHFESRLVCGDGNARWVLLQGEVFLEPSGAPARVAGTLQDVSDRVGVEQELRRQALLFESLSDAVVVLHPGGEVADWNASAERLFGTPRADAIGRTPADLFRAPGAEQLFHRIADGVRRDGRWSGGVVLPRRDGRPCEVDIVAVPLGQADGRTLGAVLLLRDVGERKALEARLQLAERMSALGTLASGMAHEINNPLAFVLGNLTFARDEVLAVASGGASPERLAELARSLDEALVGGDRIRRIVGDLRVFAHGRRDEDPEAASVNGAVEFAARMTAGQLRSRARLSLHLADLPPVVAVPSRLGQLFVNLLVNAAQAIEEGAPDENTVAVSTRLDEATRSVVAEVRDTGCGIPPEHLPRVFDPFFTTKPTGMGTGLGLSISRSIVVAAGGELTIESEVGKGTTVRVRLPAGAGPLQAPAVTPPPVVAPRARVLVVDDEPLVCTALQRMLSARHEVSTAASVDGAIAVLEAGERFDAIFCDLNMPGASGLDLHDWLEQALPDQARALVLMSGGELGERSAARLSSMRVERVCKPCSGAELERAIAARMRPR